MVMSQTRSFKPSPLTHFSNSHYNTHTVYTHTSKFCGNTHQSFMDILMFFVVVQLLSHFWLSATQRTPACHASLSFTISQSLLKPCPLSRWCYLTISFSIAPSSSCPQSFPASVFFNELALCHQVAKVLELQHQSFQWIFRVDFL